MNVEKLVKFGSGAIIIGVAGFASLFLIKSIVTLAIVTVGGIVLWNFTPLLAQWAQQMKVKGTMALSAKNPVEDLQILYQKKTDTINAAATAIAAFAKETKDFKGKLDEFISRRPEKADSFKSTYDAMKRVLDIQTNKLQESKAKMKEFEALMIEAEDIWSMTQAAIKANKAMRKFDAPNPMDELRQRTAYDSIIGSLNQVTSDLEMAVALDYSASDVEHKIGLLTHQPSDVTITTLADNKVRQTV